MTRQEAINHYGTRAKLAEAIKVSVTAIALWGESVPPLRQVQLQKLTRGKLRADDDVFEKHLRSEA